MLIAIDRSSFNYIFKYNSLTISKSQILDLSKEILESETNKNSSFIFSEFDRILPIFELDHEVLLLEVQKSKLEFDGEINLPFGAIIKVYPLTERAKNLLSGKLNQSIEISAPIFEGVIEQVKLIRSINSRKLLFNKLTKICLIQENPNPVFTQKVQSIVELLLKSQSVGNSYLANLIQYNYNPNEISSGNIEFLEKIGIIAWITTKSSNDGYTTSNYFKRCEEFKSKINKGNYVAGFKAYLEIIEDKSLDFKNSHDKINEIINEEKIEIDLFKVSYYFLALKTKLNKNNSNLLELFEEMITDVHSDNITMAYVLYLISFSFSFEQLYESIHILEKSVLLKSKFIVRDAQTIFHDLAIEDKKIERELISMELDKLNQENQNRSKELSQSNNDLDEERMELEMQNYNLAKSQDNQDKKSEVLQQENFVERQAIKPLNKDNVSEPITLFDNLDNESESKEKNDVGNENTNQTNISDGLDVSELSATYKITGDDEIEKEDELREIISLTKETSPKVKVKNVKSKKTSPKKIIETNDTFIISEITNSDNENSKNQNLEVNKEPKEKSNLMTVGIFVDLFLTDFKFKSIDNKIKIKLWEDLMSRFFNEPSMEITFDKLMAQTKFKPFLKESMFDSESEIKILEDFFKKYNQ
jgi:hypothetical protein